MKWWLLLLLTSCINTQDNKSPVEFFDPKAEKEQRQLQARLEEEREQQRLNFLANIKLEANESFQEIKPIFDFKCLSCHNSEFKLPLYARILPKWNPVFHHHEDGVKALDYANGYPLKAQGNPPQLALLKAIKSAVTDRTMPLTSYTLVYPNRKINQDDESKILNWADRIILRLQEYEDLYGAQPDDLQGQAIKILELKCFRCHANGNARGGFGQMENTQKLIADGYINLTEPESSELYQISKSGQMPPKKQEALDIKELNTLLDWLISLAQ